MHTFSSTLLLTKQMYLDQPARERTWTQMLPDTEEAARRQGLIPLREGSYFARLTWLRSDGEDFTVCAIEDAQFVRLTCEIACEEAIDAAHR